MFTYISCAGKVGLACITDANSIAGPGASGHNGSFSEYIAVDPQLAVHIPESMSFEAASTLGMGVGTAAQALYQTLELPLPLSGTVPRSRDLLIYGGSTATGSLAVQFAKRYASLYV